MGYAVRPGSNLYVDAVETFTALTGATGMHPSLAEVEKRLGLERGGLSTMFDDEGELLDATMRNAMLLLHDQCVRSMAAVSEEGWLTQFEALADAYVEWAHDHPREFQLIGKMPDDEFREYPDLTRYEHGLHVLMGRILRRAQEDGHLAPDEDVGLLVPVAYAFAHGLTVKMLSGDLSRWLPDRSPLATAQAALHLFTRRMLDAPRVSA
ncbi:TetR/AcrR family transcriptional regulator [Paracoccus aestuariivivens]|uniref:HTH-type transcriptional regulator MT1864/Rv1816-like C-terminal domain-containing protein n=1 Tax=Paracoccus aestuariivivens TaxID=1820333 RepID=A0A6L6J897_9RHOB|nr:WHG domain-containing protein [Paracoccus aestuariivivens]MTH77425.1 hypothetical protein [Paracoccus aestuariivivens]